MASAHESAAATDGTRTDTKSPRVVKAFHGVRYQVTDVLRSIAFYTEHLGFKLEHQQADGTASFWGGGSPSLEGQRCAFGELLARLR